MYWYNLVHIFYLTAPSQNGDARDPNVFALLSSLYHQHIILSHTVECLVKSTKFQMVFGCFWYLGEHDCWVPLRPNAPRHPGHESLEVPMTATTRCWRRRRCRRGPARTGRGPMRSSWMPCSRTGLEAMDQ